MWPSRKRVAVIGAGPSGLASIYSCREDDIDVVCYEKTNKLGGLWRYHEEDIDGIASVMRSTIINTSKEMNAFSTFPPPKEFSNYMHNAMMLRYFELYAEKFGLEKYIKYKHEVIRVRKSEDFGTTGRWVVTTRDLENNMEKEEVFDGVMVCTGHHTHPRMAEFPGQEQFKGEILHTHAYKKPTGYEGKRVVVVGTGNSGCDVAVELGTVCKKVYLSTRRGFWVNSRMAPSGIPIDISLNRRSTHFLQWLMPYSSQCDYLEKRANEFMDHELYQLKPKHRILGQHPTVNDLLPNRIISGLVTVKGNIERITPNGVIFENEDEETPVDVIIMGTGYKITFPFLDPEIISVNENNELNLYKYVFPPELEKPTLAVIGLIQPLGSIFTIAEMHARWFMAIFTNKYQLPSKKQMWKDIEKKRNELAKRYMGGPRHTIQVDWLPYMDEIGSQFGVKPNLLRLFLTDPKLWYVVYFGPMVAYQYRLNGPHPWPGAREALMTIEERIHGAFDTRKAVAEPQPKRHPFSVSIKVISGIVVIGSLVAVATTNTKVVDSFVNLKTDLLSRYFTINSS